jgi:protein gp37
MADNTLISWTDASWPVVAGCTKASPGCANCYAIGESWRMGHNPNEKIRSAYEGTAEKREDGRREWSGIVRSLPERLDWPLKWRKPRRIFVCNMGDLFHEDVSDVHVLSVFGIMAACPQHTFQVLTKRPERMLRWFNQLGTRAVAAARVFPEDSLEWRRRQVLRGAAIQATGAPLPSIPEHPKWPLPNVWVGVTAENQEQADKRIPLLLQVPAAVRFASVEPMLGPVDLTQLARKDELPDWEDWTYFDDALTGFVANKCGGSILRPHLNWVICGGESGPKARPMHPQWARDLRDQCQAAGTAFFFKQWGEWVPPFFYSFAAGMPDLSASKRHQFMDGWEVYRVGRKAAGDLLDDVSWKQFPQARG